MTGEERGIRAHEDLVAAGWARRHLVTAEGVDDALELYRSFGFEARAEALTPGNFGPGCDSCSLSICKTYLLVYTRRVPQSSEQTVSPISRSSTSSESSPDARTGNGQSRRNS